MAKYRIPHRELMERLASIIPGSALDSGNGLLLPRLKVAIVIEDWGPDQPDRFTAFHYDSKGLDNRLITPTFIPMMHPDPADYVAMYCMPLLIEKYYGRYLDDLYDPLKVISYWNKMLADDNAEAAFCPRRI